MRVHCFAAVCVFTFAHLPAVFGCRYTVRDVGFVDMGSPPYRLYGFVRNDTPEDIASTLKRVSVAALLDSNVESEIINIDEQPDHKAMQYFRSHTIESLPAAVLVSPDGKSLVLPIHAADKSFQETLWTGLESAVSSPARERLMQQVAQTYCTVVLIEGQNAAANARAKETVSAAIDEIASTMDQLPKPVEAPPHLITIASQTASREAVFLWSLGLSDPEITEPHVAVLYGRGRRIGPLLRGNEITRNRLLSVLSVIGASCECGLDRKWMLGTRIPLRWGSKTQAAVVKHLGFDAENPMVRTEISQILSIGGSAGTQAAGDVTFEEGILGGYRETAVEFPNESPTETISPAQLQSLAAPRPAPSEARAPLRTSLYIIGAAALLMLAGGVYILLRAWGRPS